MERCKKADVPSLEADGGMLREEMPYPVVGVMIREIGAHAKSETRDLNQPSEASVLK